MIDETRIQLALFKELISKGNYAVIPNVSWSWLSWEADLIGISKAFYMTEYEIKITKQDFKNDFKKRKHNTLKCANIGSPRVPSYFNYVAPIKAIPLCIPDYAGLMVVEIDKYGLLISEVKKAPLLHKNKLDATGVQAIMRSLMFKYWGLAQTLDNNKIQKQIYNEILSN